MTPGEVETCILMIKSVLVERGNHGMLEKP